MTDGSKASKPEAGGQSARKVLVLLCTYNEVGNIPRILAEIRVALPSADVLVMDDNSPDGTAEKVKQLQAGDDGLHLVVRSGKLGLGTATRAGLQ